MTVVTAPGLRRRHLLLAAALPLVPLSAAPAMDATLPLSVSLRDELAAALLERKALVVMVSLPGCPFCRFVRNSHLAPMLRETAQPIVQVDMQGRQPLLDVAGRATTHGAMVPAWKVRAAPTVLFLGRGGIEVAPRLVGASIPDFYGAYLGERVLAANRSVA
ncbi:MAG: hypothetical protein JWP65_1491 [Ramlibacter sp.]|jgi:thioredoxin-related protein|uniref:hypothetical protein n=1 Tax=Ramlibacter sp. TaxID=1917967 RepID=UPI002604C9A7|nr:hypothetical protein [Ramlibacter sp.]MDB5751070.1 hypothetical protein [Ramlibacter sp.]